MKHFVVDSSVAVKWFADEVDSDKAKNLLAQHLDGEIEFYAPDLFYSEIGNIFWKVSMQIAVTHSRTFYHSLYLTLSEELGFEFVTADERIFNAVHRNFPLIRLLSSLS